MSEDERQYKLITQHVNNKPIFNEINEFIVDGIETAGIIWDSIIHRESFVIIVEEFMDEYFVDDNKISQVRIICDSRNNTRDDNKKGKYYFDIEYRQKYCLNVTQLRYIIF